MSGRSGIHSDSVRVTVFVTGGESLQGVVMYLDAFGSGTDLDGVHTDIVECVVVDFDTV